MRIHPMFGVLALLCSVAAIAQDHAVTAPQPIVTPVMTQPLAGYPGKEVLLLDVEFPAGAADPVHRHDAEAFVYVLEGSIVMGVAGGKEVPLTPGQTFHEGAADLHTIGRNASNEKPARFLAFLVKDAGKPAFIPVD
ncbi:MAG: cupin domain-containing protein [Luteimonas sp.]|nr:cupin domain-containing protein [Luteimonas sp.]